jgi:hypothetical protein
MARRSCPLEGFEQCDTVPDELKKLNRSFLALFRILAIRQSSICLVNHRLLNIASQQLKGDRMLRPDSTEER